MADKRIKVVTRIVAQPDGVDELRSVLRDLIGPTRAEVGCLHYELLQNVSDPTDFTFIQEWESAEAFEAHLKSDHTQQVARELSRLVKLMPDIRRYTPVE